MTGSRVARDSLEPVSLARTSLPSIMFRRYSLWMTTLLSTPPSPSWISRARRLRSSTTAISRTVRCSRCRSRWRAIALVQVHHQVDEDAVDRRVPEEDEEIELDHRAPAEELIELGDR